MENIFQSVFMANGLTVSNFFICLISALATGVLYAFILSLKMRSTKRFFVSIAVLPAVVMMVITLVNGNIGAGIAVAGAFALVRFRSAPGTAEEIATLFVTVASGLAFGMGFIAYGVISALVLAGVYVLLASLNIFNLKTTTSEKFLKITVPEDLNYVDVFTEVLDKYTLKHELIRSKLINMGSMYKLVFRVIIKNPAETTRFIDELRVLNANLEITLEDFDVYRSEL